MTFLSINSFQETEWSDEDIYMAESFNMAMLKMNLHGYSNPNNRVQLEHRIPVQKKINTSYQ